MITGECLELSPTDSDSDSPNWPMLATDRSTPSRYIAAIIWWLMTHDIRAIHDIAVGAMSCVQLRFERPMLSKTGWYKRDIKSVINVNQWRFVDDSSCVQQTEIDGRVTVTRRTPPWGSTLPTDRWTMPINKGSATTPLYTTRLNIIWSLNRLSGMIQSTAINSWLEWRWNVNINKLCQLVGGVCPIFRAGGLHATAQVTGVGGAIKV